MDNRRIQNTDINALLGQVRQCQLCAGLPLGPRPIVQAHDQARILIAGQAPGRITHGRGRAFDDASGKRLRQWLGVDEDAFYNPEYFAILPMGFCYPGTGKQGDLPPRPECAAQWRQPLLDRLKRLQLTLVIGQYAHNWHLPNRPKQSLTDNVKAWKAYWPKILPLPHPSPRNNRWLKQNPFFEVEVLPALQAQVARLIGVGD